MSKKKNNNHSSTKTTVQNMAASIISPEMMTSGETLGGTLMLTTEGKARMNTYKKRVSKASSAEQYAVACSEALAVGEIDYVGLSSILDKLEDAVKAGKYGAIPVDDGAIKSVTLNAETIRTDTDNAHLGMIRKLISICKSYYEYDDAAKSLSDRDYDAILAAYLSTGATEPVGIIPKGKKNLKKIAIKYPTLHNNMDKSYRLHSEDPLPDGVKEQDSVFDFLQRAYAAIGASAQTEIAVEVSPKLDGVSINGTIHDDMLIDPQSRGDVDESVAVIGMSGMQVNNGFKAETDFGIQYEAFCTEADRVAASSYLMEKGAIASPYVSCRHAAAGIVHRLSTVEDDNLLQFISLYPISTEGLDGTYEERMDYIQNFGIVPKDMIQRKIIRGSLSRIVSAIERLYKKYETLRETIGYAIDGLVITVVSDEYQSTIGREGRTNKYQIALKFDPANAEAEVAGVHLDAGSKGFRTIQVDLKNPVFLDGVRYDHIPILSADLFDAMDLNRGCKVSVHRVGDVIPSISVVEGSMGSWLKLERPSKCPFCGGPLTIVNKKLFCGNQACSGNIEGLFTALFAKLGMVGYADAFSRTLRETYNCQTIGDILSLDVPELEKFTTELKKKIAETPDYDVLGAMGLPGIGPQKAKILLQNLKSLMDPDATVSDSAILSAATAAVGENQAATLMDAITSANFVTSWNIVRDYLKNITKDFSKMTTVGHTGGKLSPETIAVCKANGFAITDDKSFDILITSTMDTDSGKMVTARKKNLPIYLEKDFMAQYGKKTA